MMKLQTESFLEIWNYKYLLNLVIFYRIFKETPRNYVIQKRGGGLVLLRAMYIFRAFGRFCITIKERAF